MKLFTSFFKECLLNFGQLLEWCEIKSFSTMATNGPIAQNMDSTWAESTDGMITSRGKPASLQLSRPQISCGPLWKRTQASMARCLGLSFVKERLMTSKQIYDSAARLLLRFWYYFDTTNMGIPQPNFNHKSKDYGSLVFLCVITQPWSDLQ
jgi:hypothetical protein